MIKKIVIFLIILFFIFCFVVFGDYEQTINENESVVSNVIIENINIPPRNIDEVSSLSRLYEKYAHVMKLHVDEFNQYYQKQDWENISQCSVNIAGNILNEIIPAFENLKLSGDYAKARDLYVEYLYHSAKSYACIYYNRWDKAGEYLGNATQFLKDSNTLMKDIYGIK